MKPRKRTFYFAATGELSTFPRAPKLRDADVVVHDHAEDGLDSTDWDAIAKIQGAVVVWTTTQRLPLLAKSLLEGGTARQTPAALIRWGTPQKERIACGTLGEIALCAEKLDAKLPSLLVVGEAGADQAVAGWIKEFPLLGQSVVVTRAATQAADSAAVFQEKGASTIEIPTIRLEPPSEHEPLVEAIAGLHGYDWLVFTSSNGVDKFFEMFFKAFEDLRDLGGVRIAAVGSATAARLREMHLTVDLVPKNYQATQLAKEMATTMSLENLRVLLLRAEKANSELPRILEETGAIVDDVACYRTAFETEDPHGVAAQFAQQGANWLTFTSGSTVEGFHQRFDLPATLNKFGNLRVASIGPETTKVLAELGVKPTVEANPHVLEEMVKAIERNKSKNR